MSQLKRTSKLIQRAFGNMRQFLCFVSATLVTISALAASQDDTSQGVEDAAGESKTESSVEETPGPLTPPQVSLAPARLQQRPLVNRWRMLDAYGIQIPRGSLLDPYNQNILKGDFPIVGENVFLVLDEVYNPAATFTRGRGDGDELESQFNNTFVTAATIFHGSTVFRPEDWSVKVSGVGNINRGVNDKDDFEIKEIVGQVKLFDIGSYYDFTSVRGGYQFFKTDFNGFVFQDFNLGFEFFGELAANRHRWSGGFVSLRAKQQEGVLSFDALNQEVAFLSWIVEDFGSPGFNANFSVHHDRDLSVEGVQLDVYYFGFASAGHLGRIVLNPAVYVALGTSERAGASQDIAAYFAGVEFAYPKDYLNYRAAFFFASGDDDPNDTEAHGFDAINDNINLFGGQTSFLVGGGVLGTRPNSFLPSFRPAGALTQANFVNPGILFVNAGLDAVFTTKLFFESNFNFFRFVDTASIAATTEAQELGFELNANFAYRLLANENLVLKFGANVFLPGEAAKVILDRDDLVITTNVNLVLLF